MAEEIKAADQVVAVEPKVAEKAAEDQPKDVEERIQELSNRLTERGRAEKSLREELTAVRERAEKAEALNQKNTEWYHGPSGPASAEEKTQYQAMKATEEKTAPRLAAETRRGDLLEAIALEEDPTVKKAFKVMYDESKASGRYPDKASVEAVRKALAKSEDEAEETAELTKKVPPKVGSSRSTRSNEPSIDQQIAETEKAVREGKLPFGSVLGLYAEKQAQEKAAQGR